jgi:hypothetical protein
MKSMLLRVTACALVASTEAAVGCGSEPRADELRLESGRGPHWDELPEAKGGPDVPTGRWVVRWQEMDGFADPAAILMAFRSVEFIGDRCVLTTAEPVVTATEPGRPREPVSLPVTFHPDCSPKGLDLESPRGRLECIYKLTRDGRLVIAFGLYNDETGHPWRPSVFDPTGSQAILLVCERDPA